MAAKISAIRKIHGELTQPMLKLAIMATAAITNATIVAAVL